MFLRRRIASGCIPAEQVALAFGHATALRVNHVTRSDAKLEQRAIQRAAVLCRRRKRRTMKRDRDRGSHHFEQNLYPSGLVQPLERPHEIGKRPGQDPNVLSSDEAVIQARHIGLGSLNQRFHDTNRDGNRPTVLSGEQTRNPNRAAHRQPAIALKIEDDKKIARKEGCLHRSKLAGMTDRFLESAVDRS